MRAMRAALRAIWLLALVVACDKKGPPGGPPERLEGPSPQSSGNEVSGDAASDAAAAEVQKTLAELRRTKLDLSPRRTPSERLAFGRNRLAQLTETELVVRELPGAAEVVRVPLGGPRRVAELADGSLLAAGVDAVMRLDRKKKAPELFGRVPLFPDSLVGGDRRDADRIWVLHSFGSLLYQYAIGGDGGGIETLDFLDLEGFDQRAFCALKDGSFLYTAGDKLRRFFHGGKRWELTSPEGGEIWRILTTRRIDQVWIARMDGRIELTQITAESARVVSSFAIEHAFDVGANDRVIAVVHVSSEPGKSRRWTLAVYDPKGKRRALRELPEEPKVGAGDDWVRIVTRDKTLALSPELPFVAVGGPGALSVYNTDTGASVLTK